MPRGTKDGSMIQLPAVVGDGGKIVQPARIIVKKRYTDSQGRPREKKRVASTPLEARRIKHEIECEIEAELAGIDASRARALGELVDCYRSSAGEPINVVAAMLLTLEDGLRKTDVLLSEFCNVKLENFCNAYRFEPREYVSAVLRALEDGLCRNETVLLELRDKTVDLDLSNNHQAS